MGDFWSGIVEIVRSSDRHIPSMGKDPFALTLQPWRSFLFPFPRPGGQIRNDLAGRIDAALPSSNSAGLRESRRVIIQGKQGRKALGWLRRRRPASRHGASRSELKTPASGPVRSGVAPHRPIGRSPGDRGH